MSAVLKTSKVPQAPKVAKVRKPRTRGKDKHEVEDAVSTGPRATSAWQQTGFILPASTVTRADIARLVREFEAVDTALTTVSVRQKVGAAEKAAPVLSLQLTAFLEVNPVDLDNTTARTAYVKQLRTLKDSAPIVHMTFAVVADAESLQRLVAWLRQSVHPQTIIDVHVQPALVAGVYLRTPNHVFDLSVRNALKGKHGELVKELGALRG